MPQTAEFIDVMREKFGEDDVNLQIKRSMKGGATFYAKENGHEFGVRDMRESVPVTIVPHVEIKRSRSRV